jgi:hypothetical protein
VQTRPDVIFQAHVVVQSVKAVAYNIKLAWTGSSAYIEVVLVSQLIQITSCHDYFIFEYGTSRM